MARPTSSAVIDLYNQAKTLRQPNESDWRMASAYCLPRHYSMWSSTEGPPVNMGNGAAATRRVAYDSTAARALPKYAAVLERIATPHSMIYQNLIASDTSLMKSRRVREYLEAVRDLIFKYRYGQKANFIRSSTEVYMSMGAYGTGPVFLGQRTPNSLFMGKSFLYKAIPLRDYFILVNDEGEVVTVFRRFWLNARQFKMKFPGQPMPDCMAKVSGTDGSLAKEDKYFEFIHYVTIRETGDYDPEALDARRHPILSCYLCVMDKMYVGDEEGFRSFPYLTPRTLTESGNPYGFAPAIQVAGAMGTASAIKKSIIKGSQKAVEPTLLAHDDGVLNGKIDQRPAAVIYGGLDKQGRELVKPLALGDMRYGEKLLEDEREDINDSFFATLFKMFMESPEMTAAQVYQMVADRNFVVSPTMNAIEDEYISPATMREIDMLQEMGLIASGPNAPKGALIMPPELIEAKGEYEIVNTSPMAKAMYSEEVSGFMRSVQQATEVAQVTQDMSPLDNFDFDTAIPEMSDYMNVPARWMNDPDKKAAIRDARAKQQQQAALLKNAAPLASAAKTVQDAQTLNEANGQ